MNFQPLTPEQIAMLNETLACCDSWEADARLLGNVRAEDMRNAIRACMTQAEQYDAEYLKSSALLSLWRESKTQNAALRKMLNRCCWHSVPFMEAICLDCTGTEPNHQPDCAIAALLNAEDVHKQSESFSPSAEKPFQAGSPGAGK